MSNPTKPDPDDASDTSAADEPTAMWDADALKGLGLEEAAKAHEEPAPKVPAQPKAAATKAVPANRPKTVPKKQAASQGMSWPVTIGLALAVGIAVYFVVRLVLT